MWLMSITIWPVYGNNLLFTCLFITMSVIYTLMTYLYFNWKPWGHHQAKHSVKSQLLEDSVVRRSYLQGMKSHFSYTPKLIKTFDFEQCDNLMLNRYWDRHPSALSPLVPFSQGYTVVSILKLPTLHITLILAIF